MIRCDATAGREWESMGKPADPSLLQKRLASFGYAFRGIGTMLRTEVHARIHAVATVVVIGLGLLLEIDRADWIAVTLAITAVWCAEGFNTAFEALCDVASPEYHSEVERAKDVAAGAVLIAAIGATVIALLVFGRHLIG